jgi:myo-inositol-1(or 4)-monophosphatase
MPLTPRQLSDTADLMEECGQLALKGWEPGMGELKQDGSIVTRFDRKIEELMRQRLPRILPGSTVWGEEMGYEEPGPGGHWMLDPIDGTSNYAYGHPNWGISLGLAQEGRLTAGFIWEPGLRRRLWMNEGEPAMSEHGALKPCTPGPIQRHELMGHGSIGLAQRLNWPGKLRHLGAFVTEASLVLRGGLRGMTAGRVKLYDCAAGLLMAEALGYEIRHLEGDLVDSTAWMKPGAMRPFAIVPPDSGLPFGLEPASTDGFE